VEWEMEIRLFVVEWDALPCLAYAVLTDADENEMQFLFTLSTGGPRLRCTTFPRDVVWLPTHSSHARA
jgi:hypothetical protein